MEAEKSSVLWWKPSWRNAPPWAGALGPDGYGNWYWLSHDGEFHSVRNRHMVVTGGVAFSELAKQGPRDFTPLPDSEARRHFEQRPNVQGQGPGAPCTAGLAL